MKKAILSFLTVMFLLYCYGHFFTKGMITGIYVYYPDYPSLEAPTKVDTLVLNNDNTFKSGYYGSGTYKIEQGFGGTCFDMTYKYELGLASFGSYFNRSFFVGTPRIAVNEDLGLYYEKVD
ncbi:hypothetical protein ACX0HA_02960 [Flavobacterium hauense]